MQTFGGAFNKTAVGGEITCVDAGNYSFLTINHSITINCENAIGSTTLLGGGTPGGIGVNTAATDMVILRGLDIDNLGFIGVSNASIGFTGAGVLILDKVKINNMRGDGVGIEFAPSGAAKLVVSDSYIANNGSTGTNAGITIRPSSGVVAGVTIERTRVVNNFFGIIANGASGGIIRGMVSDSVVSGNTNNGITVSSSGSNVSLTVDNTTVSGNNFGLVAGGANAGMLVRRSVVNGNATGLFTASGEVIFSYRDNSLNGNTTTDGAFTGSVGLQ